MWDIYYNDKVMGAANVKKEGLYYIIFCECTLPGDGIYRIIVSDGNTERNLGICVPTGNRFTLCARVPVKGLNEEKMTFRLAPKDMRLSYPLETNKPFDPLDQLDSAHLEVSGEGVSVILDPAPIQQDSDPIP